MERKKPLQRHIVQIAKYKPGMKVLLNSPFDKGERVIKSSYHNGKTFMYYFLNFKSPSPENSISEIPKTKP